MRLNIKHAFSKFIKKTTRLSELKRVSVLVPTGIPGFVDAAILESVLGRAFSNDGENVCYVICQGVLPACHLVKFRKLGSIDSLLSGNWKKIVCNNCVHRASLLRHKNSIVVTLDEILSKSDRDFVKKSISGKSDNELARFSYDGINIAEHARSGALRFLAIGNDGLEERYNEVFKLYLEASFLTLVAFKKILDSAKNVKVAYLNHGIYTPQGVFNDLLKQYQINFYTWNVGYRKGTVLFSKGDTYHKTMIEKNDSWKDFKFDDKEESIVSEYLSLRSSGARDWISFNRNSVGAEKLLSVLPLKFVALFTNVNWDAQIHFDHNVFESHLDWVIKTIDFFSKLPSVGLVIRVHPAEFYGATPSRQRLADDLARIYGNLPSNIVLILPDDKTSSYELASQSIFSIVYGSKMGIELPALGSRIVVAGDSWARGRGFTYDCSSEYEYFQTLQQLLDENLDHLDKTKVQLARKFAYYYFFRRLVNINGLEKNDNGQLRVKEGLTAELVAEDPSFVSIAKQMMRSKEVLNEID